MNINILRNADVGTCEINGKTIIWIEVPQVDYTQKPIYIRNNPISGTYKRNHEGDYHCKEPEIRAMYRDSSDDGNDGGLLDGYTMDDIDPEILNAYRIRFATLNRDHVWNKDDDKTFFCRPPNRFFGSQNPPCDCNIITVLLGIVIYLFAGAVARFIYVRQPQKSGAEGVLRT